MSESRLLVVDDDAMIREELVGLFADQPYGVDCVASIDAARDVLGEQRFAVALVDVRIDGSDGIDLAREIRERWPDTDVIMITGYGSIKNAVEAMRQGAVDYITKPFQPEELLLSIQKALERRRLLDEIEYLRRQLSDRFSLRQHGQPQPADDGGVRDTGDARPQQRHRADRGRVGHGQGAGGARDSLPGQAQRRAFRRHQLRGVAGEFARERALRLPARRVHRSGDRPRGQDRACRAAALFFSTRSRPSRLPMQAKLLRVLEERSHRATRWQSEASTSTCAWSRRPTENLAEAVRRRGPDARGLLLPDQRGAGSPAAAARAASRTSRCWSPSFSATTRWRARRGSTGSARRRSISSPPTSGRATFVSSSNVMERGDPARQRRHDSRRSTFPTSARVAVSANAGPKLSLRFAAARIPEGRRARLPVATFLPSSTKGGIAPCAQAGFGRPGDLAPQDQGARPEAPTTTAMASVTAERRMALAHRSWSGDDDDRIRSREARCTVSSMGCASVRSTSRPIRSSSIMNARYREALASLHYGVTQRKGFITLIGEAGTGKTTLLKKLLNDLDRERRARCSCSTPT